jgi:hypothetical protein
MHFTELSNIQSSQFMYQIQDEPVEITICTQKNIAKFKCGDMITHISLTTGSFVSVDDNDKFDTTPIIFFTSSMIDKL